MDMMGRPQDALPQGYGSIAYDGYLIACGGRDQVHKPGAGMTAATLIQGRCNPYGAETGGPKRVLGGLHGPASARTPGMNLPDSIEQGEWPCKNRAAIRCRAICRCSHQGQVMQLCSWHDEPGGHTEIVAGVTRWVSETVRVRGHYEEFTRRQAGLCPRCAWPPPYAELHREIGQWQAEMYQLFTAGLWKSPRARVLKTQVIDAGLLMDAARKQGIIHQCPLTLVPVS